MMRALLCSGQGRIERNMLDRLAGVPEAGPIFATARDLLGRDVLDLLAHGDEETILQNRTSQILCVTRALAAAACLHVEGPALVAGYSVGEMAAWSIAGFWRSEQALRLTARRAELMDAADGDGGLGFVRGLDAAALDRLLAAHGCAIAIRNPGDLYIIGGAREAVAACCVEALQRGAPGARPIAVHVASHTPRLAAAVAPFLDALRREGVAHPKGPIVLIGAAQARVIDAPEDGLPGLAHQLATTVDWNAVLTALVERGARRMLELGPGSALAEMVHASWPDIEVRSLDDFRTLEGARRWFEAA